jgi:small subunit ribosomal protein S17e
VELSWNSLLPKQNLNQSSHSQQSELELRSFEELLSGWAGTKAFCDLSKPWCVWRRLCAPCWRLARRSRGCARVPPSRGAARGGRCRFRPALAPPAPAPTAPSRRAPAHARSSARRYSQGVRTKTIKKSARNIIEKYYQRLTLDFHTNKRVVDEVAILPSKRMRNKIAGFVTHLMKRIQRGPVRNISLKLQEEERERRLDFVPEVSAIDTELIEIDSETKAMLDFLQMENLPGVQVATVSLLPASLPVRLPPCARAPVPG